MRFRRHWIVVGLLAPALLAAGPRRKPNKTPPPPPLAPGEVSVPIGGTADAVRAGGGGRYLVFHLAQGDDLVVVDVLAGHVAHLISAPGDVRFAVGRDKVVVVDNGQHVVQRFDLATGRREKSVLLTDDRPVAKVSMGSDSAGPLALWFEEQDHGRDPADGVQFWDVSTLRRLTVAGEVDDPRGESGNIWPSADGRTFCLWGWTSGPFDLLRLTDVTPTSATCRLTHTADGDGYNRAWAMPTADGSQLVHHDGAVYADAAAYEPVPSPPGPLKGATLLPTADPRFLLALRRVDPKVRGVAATSSVAVVAAADRRVLFTIGDVGPVTGGQIRTDVGRLGTDPRVYYLPADNRLAYVPDGDDHVVVRPFDLAAALAGTGADYLFVTSKPPATATAGTAFQYQIQTLGSGKKVTYKLEERPAGMAVSATGLVTWTATADATDDVDGTKVPVVVTVAGDGGREVTHGFGVRVVPALPPPGGAVAADGRGVVNLAAAAARLVGGHLRYHAAGYVAGWETADDAAQWRAKVDHAGWYAVEATYGAGYGVGSYEVTVGKASLAAPVTRIDGDAMHFTPFPVGTVELPAGEVAVTLHGTQVVGGMMNLRSVRLTPATRPPPGDAVAAAPRPGAPARPPAVRPPAVRPPTATPPPAPPPADRPPNDPDLAAVGERLARRVAADMTADAAGDPDASINVSAYVGRAARTNPAGGPTTAGQLTIRLTQNVSPLPSGDMVTITSDVDALVRRVDGKWTCDAATLRVTSVSSTHGPVGGAVHRTRDVTRAVAATLDDLQSDDPPEKPRPNRPADERVPLQKV